MEEQDKPRRRGRPVGSVMTPERREQKRLERLNKRAKKDRDWSDISVHDNGASLADSKAIWDEVEGMKNEPIEKKMERLSEACYMMRDDIVLYLRETNDMLRTLINQTRKGKDSRDR